MSEADGMRTAVARIISPSAFRDNGREDDRQTAINRADAILRLVSLGEPVAWHSRDRDGNEDVTLSRDAVEQWARYGRTITPLYAPPSTQEASQ